MVRQATADTAGNALTIQASGATVGATNKNGGDLILVPGISTGTGTSHVIIQTPTPGTTGTADNSPATRAIIDSNGIAVTGKVTVTDDIYDATTWDANTSVPTKNAVRDKMETKVDKTTTVN